MQGGGCIWDYAATRCLAEALGVSPVNFLGDPLKLNNPQTTYFNHCGVIYTANKTLQKKVLQWGKGRELHP